MKTESNKMYQVVWVLIFNGVVLRQIFKFTDNLFTLMLLQGMLYFAVAAVIHVVYTEEDTK